MSLRVAFSALLHGSQSIGAFVLFDDICFWRVNLINHSMAWDVDIG